MSELQLERMMEEVRRIRMEDSWVAWDMNDSEGTSGETPQVLTVAQGIARSAVRSLDKRDMLQPISNNRVDHKHRDE